MSYVGKVLSGGASHLVASSLYGVCSTISNTAEKIVSLSDFDALITGITIQVKFQYTNTASQPTLNVNGTGAYPIYTDSTNYPGNTRLTSWYPNAVVSLTFDGTAWRMNDVDINAANGMADLFNVIYPVGSIYLSTTSTNPGTLFGGSWQQINGRFLFATDGSHAAGTTGGAETFTLATANLPSHTHTVGAHAHGLNSHTHSVPAHAHGLNSHTHSVPAHAHGLNSHTHSVGGHVHGLNSHVHSVGAHAHSLNSHTHSIPALSGTAASAGAHTHSVDGVYAYYDGTTATYGHSTYWTDKHLTNLLTVNESGAHTHSVTTNSSATGGPSTTNTGDSNAFNTGVASGNTASSSAFASGGPSTANTNNSSILTSGGPSTANTANSSALTSGGPSTTSTANSDAFNSGATGSGTAVNKMPPYLSVYCWKRVA